MKKNIKILSSIFASLVLALVISVSSFAEGLTTVISVSIPGAVTLQVGNHGKVSLNGTEYTGYVRLPAAGGESYTYTISPSLLYRIDKVIYNGTDVTSSVVDNTFAAPPTTGNDNLSVSFKLIGSGTPTYKLTFHSNGHGTDPAVQYVLSGYKAYDPSLAKEGDWTFYGWYKNNVCSEDQKFDFNTAITSDMDLYALWKQDEKTSVATTPGAGESTASASNETGSEAGNDTTIDDNNSASEAVSEAGKNDNGDVTASENDSDKSSEDSESSDDNEQNESLVGDNGEGEASTENIEPEDVPQNSGGLLPNPWVWIILGCLLSVTVVLGAIYISKKNSTEE